jgi:outer membrane protein TolC
MKIKKLLIGGIFCLSALNLAAQSNNTLTFTLAEAQNYAIENYFVSRNASLDIEKSKKQVWEYTSMGLPQVNAGATYTHIPEVPTMKMYSQELYNTIPADNHQVTGSELANGLILGYNPEPEVITLGVTDNIAYNVTVSQLIFSGEYLVGLQASRTVLKMSVEVYEKTKIEIKQLVANSYFTILILQKNKELLTETTENLKKISGETHAISEKGLLDKTEADQIDINVKRIENQLFSVQRQLEFMNKMFRYQLGLSESTNVQLTDSLQSLLENNLFINSGDYFFDLNNHIDFKLLTTQEQLKLLNLQREKSTYLPTLAGFYKYSDNTNTASFDFTMKHMVGVSLDFPIFASGLKQSKVGQAKIGLIQAEDTREQESTRLIMEAQQALFDYQSALEKFNNEKDNFDLSKRILESTTQKFKLGMVSSMDLTLTNNQYIQAELTYSGAILDLLNAKVKLDKAYSKL